MKNKFSTICSTVCTHVAESLFLDISTIWKFPRNDSLHVSSEAAWKRAGREKHKNTARGRKRLMSDT